MDPIRPNIGGGSPLVRHRGIAIFTLATVSLVAAARYKANAMHKNEQAQKNSSSPNLHVSVDRSGGGI